MKARVRKGNKERNNEINTKNRKYRGKMEKKGIRIMQENGGSTTKGKGKWRKRNEKKYEEREELIGDILVEQNLKKEGTNEEKEK